MTIKRSKKTWYIALPLSLAVLAGAGFAGWKYFIDDGVHYPRAIMKQATELQDRILSFDSHITVP
ncbi:membrane dipeptidase, partial [Pseudomonas quasicaspiana]|nr:membrane dipeptidase [Pseudomonas quasicaspiana]